MLDAYLVRSLPFIYVVRYLVILLQWKGCRTNQGSRLHCIHYIILYRIHLQHIYIYICACYVCTHILCMYIYMYNMCLTYIYTYIHGFICIQDRLHNQFFKDPGCDQSVTVNRWPRGSPVTAAKENKNAIYKTEIRRLNRKLEQAQQKPEIIPVAWIGKTIRGIQFSLVFSSFHLSPLNRKYKKWCFQ